MTAPVADQGRVRTFAWGRLAFSLVLLVGTLAWLAPERIWERFKGADPGWLVLALCSASLGYPLLAARWSFLSARAGAPLRFASAIREYYLSTLLNQLLPFGVAGDAFRAMRRFHAERSAESRRGAVGALVADRVSGQVVLWAWVIAVLPGLRTSVSAGRVSPLWLLIAVAVTGAVVLAWRAERVREWLRTCVTLLGSPGSASVHVPLSAALVALHVVTFWASARALGLGLELDLVTALHLVPLILCAGSLPAFFAGWGAREIAAAGLYHLSGLRSGDGASASLLFGLVSLVASAPGIFLLDRPLSGRR